MAHIAAHLVVSIVALNHSVFFLAWKHHRCLPNIYPWPLQTTWTPSFCIWCASCNACKWKNYDTCQWGVHFYLKRYPQKSDQKMNVKIKGAKYLNKISDSEFLFNLFLCIGPTMFWEVDKNCVNQLPAAVLFIFRKCCCIYMLFQLIQTVCEQQIQNIFPLSCITAPSFVFTIYMHSSCFGHQLWCSNSCALCLGASHLLTTPSSPAPPSPPPPPPPLLGQFCFGGCTLYPEKPCGP